MSIMLVQYDGQTYGCMSHTIKIDDIPVFGDWEALDTIKEVKDPDFFIYLGDTIYSDFRTGSQL